MKIFMGDNKQLYMVFDMVFDICSTITDRIIDALEQGTVDIGIYTYDYKNEYICLTDIARYRSIDPCFTVRNWLRGRDIIEFLGLWETLHNPNFKRVDFDTFKKDAGTNAFVFSIKQWTGMLSQSLQ